MGVTSRLALGTVQFGLHYGITNTKGRVASGEIDAILSLAAVNGIDTLDTAALYGDAESMLGQSLARIGKTFRIVSKTAKRFNAESADDARSQVRRDLETSLERLKATRLEALLAHDPAELLGQHGDARFRAMQDARSEGMVVRIGASTYTGTQIDMLLDRYAIDVVQAPLNAADRRLIRGGQLRRLCENSVAFHARSLFLQGLLLVEPNELEARFSRLRPFLVALDRAAADQGLSRLAVVLNCVLSRRELERAVVGVTTADELQQILRAEQECLSDAEDMLYDETIDFDQRLLDPSQWPNLV